MDLNFKKIGEGPSIIVLHGLFGMSDNWLSIAKKMSKDYCFYLLDLRNHGRSAHSNEFNYAVMTNDLRDFVEKQNLSNVILIGHSMGGKIAMQFATNHARFVKKLVVVDIAPKKYTSSLFTNFIDVMLAVNLSQIKMRKDIEQLLLSQLNTEPAIVYFLLKNLYRDDNNRFHWRINLGALRLNINSILDTVEITTPVMLDTLFVKGSESNYIDFDDELIIKENFPNARIVEIEKATHWVHSSAPVNFENELRAFL